MKNIKLTLIALSAAVILSAQTGITVTALTNAVTTACPATLTLTSTSGATAGSSSISIDDEIFRFRTVVSSTVVNVTCAQNGTKATKHGAGTAAYVGPTQNFTQVGGQYTTGSMAVHMWSGLGYPTITPATVTTATAVTLTVGQIKGGLILEDPNGGAATATLPTAALLVAAMPGAQIGTSIYFDVRNTADASETLTVAVGSGGTASGTMTIAQNNAKRFVLRFTNVLSGTEAYTLYSLGTFVF